MGHNIFRHKKSRDLNKVQLRNKDIKKVKLPLFSFFFFILINIFVIFFC